MHEIAFGEFTYNILCPALKKMFVLQAGYTIEMCCDATTVVLNRLD